MLHTPSRVHLLTNYQTIYQYAFKNAQNVYAGLIQTETPYFQPNPKAPTPFSLNPTYGDPATIGSAAYGLTITNSHNIFVYGAGLYSFFQVPSPCASAAQLLFLTQRR